MLHADVILLFMPPSMDPERSPERFLHKNRRFPKWGNTFSTNRACLQDNQTLEHQEHKQLPSPILSSTRRRRKTSQPTKMRILKARSFPKMSRFSSQIHPIY